MTVDLSAGTYRPTWKNRRRVIFASLVFTALEVAGVFVAGLLKIDLGNSQVAETIIGAAHLFAAGIIGSYVFGAVKDDSNLMGFLSKGKTP